MNLNRTNLAGVLEYDPGEISGDDEKPPVVRERRQVLAVLRDGHPLQRPDPDPELLHPVLLHGEHVIPDPQEHLHSAGHRVLGLDDGDAQRELVDPGVGELARPGVLEVGDAEDLVAFGDGDDAVAPEDAFGDALLEALLAEGDWGADELGADVVAVEGAVLDEAVEEEVVGPGHADEAAAGAVPGGGGEWVAGGGEDEELAARGLGEELDDLGVVADGGHGAAEWRAGDAVAGEVHPGTAPLEAVELRLPVEAVVELLPLRRDGDGRHGRGCSGGI